MSKRNPTSELNHDNWNEDDEKEDAGHFKVAAQDVLKKREIRVAKRRNYGGEEAGTGQLFKSFTGFAGFGATGASQNTVTAASLTLNAGKQQQDKEEKNGKSNHTNEQHLSQLKALNQSVMDWIRKHVTDNPYCVLTPIFRDYERHLAEIERKYPYKEEADDAAAAGGGGLKSASSESASKTGGGGIGGFKFSSGEASKSSGGIGGFKFSSGGAASAESTPADGDAAAKSKDQQAVTFNFAASSAASSSSSPAVPTPQNFNFAGAPPGQFVFKASKQPADGDNSESDATKDKQQADKDKKEEDKGKEKAPATSLFGFSFKPTGEAAAAPAFSLLGSGSQQKQQEEEEEYEPPKPETREIKESGAVYTKRCKLFYMSPDTKEWRDKGVGNLHVKPSDGKAQFIVRADNTLGTILLNTIINKDMSLTTNKNNLNFACVPNPPLKLAGKEGKDEGPRLVPFLIKVKTKEDAKELLRHLDEQRGK